MNASSDKSISMTHIFMGNTLHYYHLFEALNHIYIIRIIKHTRRMDLLVIFSCQVIFHPSFPIPNY